MGDGQSMDVSIAYYGNHRILFNRGKSLTPTTKCKESLQEEGRRWFKIRLIIDAVQMKLVLAYYGIPLKSHVKSGRTKSKTTDSNNSKTSHRIN